MNPVLALTTLLLLVQPAFMPFHHTSESAAFVATDTQELQASRPMGALCPNDPPVQQAPASPRRA